jgi:hypothetical protein
MARPEAALKMIERFPETFVTEMRHIKDDAESFHFLEQLASALSETTRGVGALRISSRTVMRRAKRSESLRVSALKMFEGYD